MKREINKNLIGMGQVISMYIMVFNRNEYMKEYMRECRKTPVGIKNGIKSKWKFVGIIHNQGLDYLYDNIYLPATHCQKCNIELFSDGYSSRKCCDHDHSIVGEHNFRAVLCNTCNVNDRMDNTSGVPNVSYNNSRKRWVYEKITNGVKHFKRFKTKEEAVEYKKIYES